MRKQLSMILAAGLGLLLVAATAQVAFAQINPSLEGEQLVAPDELLDINTATVPQLRSLPGIGNVIARAIRDYRDAHGPFGSVDDLTSVQGVNAALVNDIRPRIIVVAPGGAVAGPQGATVHTSGSSPDTAIAAPGAGLQGAALNLNTATVPQLRALQGVNRATALAIIEFRGENGPYVRMRQLLQVQGVNQSTLDLIRPHVTIGPAGSAVTGPEGAQVHTTDSAPETNIQAADPGLRQAVVNINAATVADLRRLDGVNRETARRIVNYREENGPYNRVRDLANVPGIDQALIDRIREHITAQGN